MNRRTAISIIRTAFAALTKRQRANLRYHAYEGTPVLCGKWAELYVSAEDHDAPPGGA